MDDIFFPSDGYTATAKIEEVRGVHGEARITYRPALYQEREEWRVAAGTASGEKKAKLDLALLKKHLHTINGAAVPTEKLGLLRPMLTQKIMDRILGYDPEEERADAKN